jgi:hypothetical protein
VVTGVSLVKRSPEERSGGDVTDRDLDPPKTPEEMTTGDALKVINRAESITGDIDLSLPALAKIESKKTSRDRQEDIRTAVKEAVIDVATEIVRSVGQSPTLRNEKSVKRK